MNLKKSLSWKFLLPAGIVLLIFFYSGALGLLGLIMTLMGIIDLIRQIANKRKMKKTKIS